MQIQYSRVHSEWVKEAEVSIFENAVNWLKVTVGTSFDIWVSLTISGLACS